MTNYRSRSLSLLEVVISFGLFGIASVAMLQSMHVASQTSAEAEREQLLHDHASATLEIAQRTALSGPGGLFALCGAQGLIVPEGGRHPNLVAVIRTTNLTTGVHEVDLAAVGITNSTRRCVRIHVQALWVQDPSVASPALLQPLTGTGFPARVDLVTYRELGS